MNHHRITYVCLAILCVTACDAQNHPAAVTKITQTQSTKPIEIKSVETKNNSIVVPAEIDTATQKVKSKLNLSIKNISMDNEKCSDNFLDDGNLIIEENSELFNKLCKSKSESGVNLSGDFLTNKNADEDTSYLKKVDGLEIKIKGNFE